MATHGPEPVSMGMTRLPLNSGAMPGSRTFDGHTSLDAIVHTRSDVDTASRLAGGGSDSSTSPDV